MSFQVQLHVPIFLLVHSIALFFFVRLGQELSATVSDGSRCVLVLESLRLCCRVFFSLNWQDLPEFFEDHIAEWMGEFERYLCYEKFSLGADVDDDEEGPVERLQAAIVENASLYAQKFATRRGIAYR